MKRITSVHHQDVKHLIQLQHRSYRTEHQQFMIEGTRAYTELLQLYTPIAIYLTDQYLQSSAQNFSTEITTIVSQHIMEKISHATTPSGICAIFSIPKPLPLPTTGPGIVLVEISDPGNLGTLLRTAAAMNIQHVILVGGVDPYNPKVIQSTAGCLGAVKIYQATFEQLIEQRLELCALIVKQGKKPDEINFANTFLVVGNEAHGLTEAQIAACQQTMTIEMPGKAESLNAAVAGSIALYLMAQKK